MPLGPILDLLERVLEEFCVMQVQADDTIQTVADEDYQKLTTVADIANSSNLRDSNIIQAGNTLSIPVKCFCGDPSVSRDYGLFTTYVVQATDQLTGVAASFVVSADVLSRFNSDANVLTPDSVIFIPTRGISHILLCSCLCNFKLYVLLVSASKHELLFGG
jgi:LysM repeat protein